MNIPQDILKHENKKRTKKENRTLLKEVIEYINKINKLDITGDEKVERILKMLDRRNADIL